uniref:SFRICE_018525 n=1 Tax=Spodoptera frugiperda TaxID=7108 RepID=A0A2H1WUL5_SPOFR
MYYLVMLHRCNSYAVRGRFAVRIYYVSILGKPSIARIFPYKKHRLAKPVSISTKLCVRMNMIGGSQTHLQQSSISHIWWKSTLRLSLMTNNRFTNQSKKRSPGVDIKWSCQHAIKDCTIIVELIICAQLCNLRDFKELVLNGKNKKLGKSK